MQLGRLADGMLCMAFIENDNSRNGSAMLVGGVGFCAICRCIIG